MEFRVVLPEDGRELKVSVPVVHVRLSYSDAMRTTTADMAKAVVDALYPPLARRLERELPPAAPLRKLVERDESNHITGTVDQPATPSAMVRAQEIAARIAAHAGKMYADAYLVSWANARFRAADNESGDAV